MMRDRIDKLIYSSEILRRLNNSKRVALIISDKSGNIIDCSPGVEIALGYTKEELKMSGWLGLTHPSDAALDEAFMKKCISGEIVEYTIKKRYIHKLGHTVPVLLTVMLVNGGVVPHGLFVCYCHFPETCGKPCLNFNEASILEIVPHA